jgi:hypothetical protein
MYIVPIAWIYVALMMSVAEATNANGTVLGAVFTFLFYGLMPVALIMYFLGTPARKRAIRARAAQEQEQAALEALQPDASSHTSADPVAPVREKS